MKYRLMMIVIGLIGASTLQACGSSSPAAAGSTYPTVSVQCGNQACVQ